MATTIKTVIRVRPLLPSEINQGYNNTRLSFAPNKSEVSISDASSQKKFRCDHLITEDVSQDQTFSKCELSQFVEKVLQGYNSTIFAYGQTGSGKSYTMHGGDEGEGGGITARLVKLLYKRVSEQKAQCQYSISMSFLQIYSERIFDLLNPTSLNNRSLSFNQSIEGLRLRWNKDEQFTVQNLFAFQCKDEAQLLKYVGIGLKNRISAAHKLNLQSSRSHSILRIKVQATEGSSTRNSRIDLVDLAGSERIGLTKTEGRLAKESIDINKSLFTLRQVINVLSQNSGKKKDEKMYVPYRDSKLTSILKQSIGGNSYCLMIACLTPNDAFLQQNLSTLTYTTKASFITNNPVLNLDPNTKTIVELRKQLSQVNSELEKANKHIEFLSQLKDRASSSVPKKQHSQKQLSLPSPQFGKKLAETLKMDYNSNISERLIESINMVRELLKSNKQLREKMEEAEYTIQDMNGQICQLTQENQALRQQSSQPPGLTNEKPQQRQQSSRYEEKNMSSQGHRRHSLKIPAPLLRPPTQEHKIASQVVTKGFIQTEKTIDLGSLYLNQKGVDSAPTNFNRRITSTSHDRRPPFSRGSSEEIDRHAITAKFSKRGWLLKDNTKKGFFSFYDGQQDLSTS